MSMGSKDNMTALVVKFPAQKVGSGGGVLARRQLRDVANTSTNNNNSATSFNPNESNSTSESTAAATSAAPVS